MEKKKTKTTTIRLPIELYDRITILATKRLCSINKWVVHTLEREVKPKS